MQKDPTKILLIEDDGDDFVLTRDLLSGIDGGGFHLDWARNYEEGLKQIQARLHDVYLIDYRLGAHTGLELLRQAVQAGVQSPIILLTGQGDREIDTAAMQAGAADYLEKGRMDAPLLERAIRYSLEHSRLVKEISELAARDSITGLYNHREMLRFLDYELGRSRRYNHRLSLVLMDIDHFKAINDRCGHPSGDEALRQIAETLQSHYRTADMLARYGGDEFAVVMPETSAETAMLGASRLRKVVEARPIHMDCANDPVKNVTITVSLGVAEYPGDAETGHALIEAADQALYEAKRQGRNRVVRFWAERAEKDGQDGRG